MNSKQIIKIAEKYGFKENWYDDYGTPCFSFKILKLDSNVDYKINRFCISIEQELGVIVDKIKRQEFWRFYITLKEM